MQRYFGRIVDNKAVLEDDDIFHILKVMRMRKGEHIEVVSDERLYECELTSIKPIDITVIKSIKEANELTSDVILVAALLKGDKMDFVVQKATELGVQEIVFLITKRTIVKVKKFGKDFKFDRYRRIAKEASEQSKRVRLPVLTRVLPISRIREVKAEVKAVAYEGVSGSTKSFNEKIKDLAKGKRLAIVIGPEGGFEEDEIEFLNDRGYTSVSFGKRILRAETASLYALSVISNYLERK